MSPTPKTLHFNDAGWDDPEGKQPGDLLVFTVKEVEFVFRWCPPGSFRMGSRDLRMGRRPVRKITLGGFWMGETPVTQEQWWAVPPRGTNKQSIGEVASEAQKKNPVDFVSWWDACFFCNRLAASLDLKDGYDLYQVHINADEPQYNVECTDALPALRLPTEAQWEYACRAGSETEYWSGDGDAALAMAGLYKDNSGLELHPVGERPANPWGLFDMHGNVSEWCWDEYFPAGIWKDPFLHRGFPYRSLDNRAVRGGAWFDPATTCQSAFPSNASAERQHKGVGFRLCLPLPAKKESSEEGRQDAGARDADLGSDGGRRPSKRAPTVHRKKPNHTKKRT